MGNSEGGGSLSEVGESEVGRSLGEVHHGEGGRSLIEVGTVRHGEDGGSLGEVLNDEKHEGAGRKHSAFKVTFLIQCKYFSSYLGTWYRYLSICSSLV